MLNEKEARKLIKKLRTLQKLAAKSKSDKAAQNLSKFSNECVDKFKYIVFMHTNKYKGFPNYEDLNQEGFEALTKAIKNYDANKGSIFWWFHKYIETRIARSANLHTTIRYPLKFAKIHTPHKESVLPILIEGRFCPDKSLENAEVSKAVRTAMEHLNKEQKGIIDLVFGFDGDKPLSINKICKKMNISRLSCIRTINNALSVLKSNIHL